MEAFLEHIGRTSIVLAVIMVLFGGILIVGENQILDKITNPVSKTGEDADFFEKAEYSATATFNPTITTTTFTDENGNVRTVGTNYSGELIDIYLKTTPPSKDKISYADMFYATQGNKEISAYEITRITNEADNSDAIANGQVTVNNVQDATYPDNKVQEHLFEKDKYGKNVIKDNQLSNITFNQHGIYRIFIRVRGSSTAKKSFLVSITD